MKHRLLVTAAALCLVATAAARAEESEPAEDGPLSKLSVHGFLTQAYAKSDGATIYGIPEDAEYIDADFERIQYSGYYGQLSWNVTDRLGLHLQHSRADLTVSIPPVFFFDLDFADENALSVTYSLSPHVLLKAEYHDFEGFTFESGAAGILGAPLDVSFGIASIATSF